MQSSEMDGRLRPVSFVVLGLLATAGPQTPYELERNVSISVSFFFHVARSQLHAEPRRLEGLGLVTSEREEEPGWRGFALPRLQQAMSPLTAAGLLGVLWALWHLPMFAVKAWDTPKNGLGDLVAYVLFCVGLSVIMSWVANTAKGSILLPMLAHNALNWALTILPLALGRITPGAWTLAVAGALLAVVATAASRGRLGFGHGRARPLM